MSASSTDLTLPLLRASFWWPIQAPAKLAPRASRFRLEDFVRAYLEHSKVHKSHSSYRADRLALDKLLADEDFGPNKILEQIASQALLKFMGRLKATRTQGYFPGGARSSGRTPLPRSQNPRLRKAGPAS